jgi:WD40 repeat protein
VARLVERVRALRPGAALKTAANDRIQVNCPRCGKGLKVKAALAGKKGKCPHCQAMIIVPSAVPPAVDERTLPPQSPEARTIAPLGQSSPAIHRKREMTAVPEGAAFTQAPPGGTDADLCDFLAPPQVLDETGRLGPYCVLEALGAGGMGVVFKAEDPGLQRLVALKAMLPGLASSGSAKQRFLREARAAAAIKHDHIVTIFQVGEDRGAPFLAMEFLEGEPLDRRLERQAKLPLAEVLRISREIADGLQAAHERGLTHRDIKPANIWLEGNRGRVKVLDFGLARGGADDAQLTQQGVIVGTPAYMAPEQAQGKSIGPRCDLFSLGCILYRMATGQPPFRGNDTISTLVAVATEDPRPPQELEPALPSALSKLILSLLAKAPEDRPASAQVVAAALDRIARRPHASSAPTMTSPRPSRRSLQGRPWRWLAVAGAVVFVLGLGTWLLLATVFKVRVKTSEGEAFAVLEIDQPGAEVLVDGAKMTVTVPGDNKPVVIQVAPGQHKLRINKDGFEAFTREIELAVGKSPPFRVALVPAKRPPPTEPAGTPSGSPAAALDAMRREDLSPEALVAAGGGDPNKAPKGLVGILGEAAPVHTAAVARLAFSPDGRWLASASHDTTVMLWDTITGQARRVLRGHSRLVNAVAFSRDSRTVISGSFDGTLKLWDVDRDTPPQTVKTDFGEVWSMTTSRDGRFIAAGNHAGIIKLWKWGAWGAPVHLLKAAGLVHSLAFSSDGELLAVGTGEARQDLVPVRVFRTADGKLFHTLPAHPRGVTTVDISRDGKWLASIGADDKPKPWELPSGKAMELPKDNGNRGFSIAFSPDSTMLAVEGRGGFVVLDVPSGIMKYVRPFPTTWCTWCNFFGLVFSPDGKLLATGDDWGSVEMYDTSTWQLHNGVPTRGHRDAITGLAVSPDGRFVLTAGHDHALRRWDLDRPRESHVLFPSVSYACRPFISPDGKSMAVSNTFAHPAVFDATSKYRYALPQWGDGLAYSPDSTTLAWSCYDKHIRLWDVANNKEMFRFPGAAKNLAYSPDGKYLAAATESKTVKIWNMDTGVEVPAWDDAAGVMNVAFSPDGKVLVCGLVDGTISLWDFAKKTKLRTWLGHSRRPDCMKFLPDSKALVSSAADGTVRLWNTESNRAREVISLGPPDHPLVCDLSPSGKYLFVEGHSPAIFVLRLPPSEGPPNR